eukprot:SRR837773.9585.p1 GENE.SRR837773.9585~~SRR837773.9585.p1  ORF type:complete len:350 (-),score=62.74 SRR837773.9585:58-1011(-)
MAVILMKTVLRVRRLVAPQTVLDENHVRSPLLLELISVLRVLTTTLVPVLLATFGGGSPVLVEMLAPAAQDCSVRELGGLLAQGYHTFNCQDGFVATQLQRSIRINKDMPEEQQRLGFVAPVFTSRGARAAGEAPVAWAVQVDGQVESPWRRRGICGFFAWPLQHHMAVFNAPRSGFGEAWGFGLSQFSHEDMAAAAGKIRVAYGLPQESFTPGDEVFIVTKTIRQFFGCGTACLWAMIGLLAVGLLDRLHDFADGRVIVVEDGFNRYVGLVRSDEDHLSQVGCADLAQVSGYWNQPLGDSKVESLRVQWSPRGALS